VTDPGSSATFETASKPHATIPPAAAVCPIYGIAPQCRPKRIIRSSGASSLRAATPIIASLSARADVLTTGLSLTPNAYREPPSLYVTEAEPAVPRSKLARECALRFSQLVKSHREQKSSAIEDMTKA
jgi:hypothetical protein